jgi:hypothetical protein
MTAHETDPQPEYEIEVIVRGSAGNGPTLAMLRVLTTGSRACVFPARGGVV